MADLLVDNIILRFGMPLVIHSDQGREFENGLIKSLCTLLMMLSMFVNDRRNNWHKLLPYVMHAYRTSVHELTGYSPFRLMMGEECSLPHDVSTAELAGNTTFRRIRLPLGYETLWKSHMTMCVSHSKGQQPAGNGYMILRR